MVNNPDQPDKRRSSKKENDEADEDDEDDWEDEDQDDVEESEYSSVGTSAWEETMETLTSGVGGLNVQKQLTRKNGWEVYGVKGTASDEEAKAKGGIQKHGHWSWKFDMGKSFDRIDMCVKDNVLISVAYFYQLIPPRGTNPPWNGICKLVPHPEGALPFIEIQILNNHECYGTFSITPEGLFSVAMADEQRKNTAFVGVWNWKTGLCMGVSSSAVSTIPLPVPNKAIADPNILPTQALHLEVIPMGPLVLVASSRKTPASRDPFDYEMLRMRHEGHPDRAKPGDSYIDFSIDSYALLSVCYPPPQTKKRHHPESCTIPFGPVRMERIVVMNAAY
ncbi:hypothetical protein C343_00850 [Cryptococcus neoformans C23]|uniref:Uncharacterized protein n=2 Tax=Cryptococcus neoformans TaxID=5207 RepID=A0A854QRD0_CRYNE|nr:hypothetical protein CNAG_00833 [Cryptococcus neoformans var. grubii H99]AUB22446.1 hypothetical protein CKF44_00833 [Cryptococcus neoformans var. grubii]OWZ36074.1 hypothetical protein C347_00923 [Cryptococcus neoformans var. grubii AD2-60a]OWZ47723.1 hypothetical protein C343_00850 [Cryptococcus neoformans var. grubii C23]OXC86815.1 hypothetical protein C344_00857 [Cryptococcus neoformans var. grubii AD1-7a]OXG29189.1 hypothetical protein C361_00846 [Cryptococcus neoformans var. grubii Tu|eukprot:XP_012046993.1 hypothetical protein CNAG_00833 [Cryptococcus neoformans var. grubii H99]